MLMRSIQRSFLRTCAAFATTIRPPPLLGPSPPPTTTPTTISMTTRTPSRLFATDNFTPAAPPGTHGTPVFPDVDFSIISDEATRRNQDPNAVFVVTGASRGIGLQFVKALSQKTQGKIVACCRKPQEATKLNEFKDDLPDPSRIQVMPLDLEEQSSIEALGTFLRNEYSRVDVLLNVAGLLGDGKNTAGPERTITRMDREWFSTSLAINLIGPVMLTKEVLPLLTQPRRRPSNNKDDDTSAGRPAALVANLSARVGSISDNRIGGWYSYRISKAGLNQATRTMALELGRQNVWCVALHPGTTDTDLSKPFQANVKKESLFPVEFTVNQLLSVTDSVHAEHSGGLYDWAGKSISF